MKITKIQIQNFHLLKNISLDLEVNLSIKYKFIIFSLIAFWLTISYASGTCINTDNYLRGYVQSVFVHNYGISSGAVTVVDGRIIISEENLGSNNAEQVLNKIKQSVADLKGVKEVVLRKQATYNLYDIKNDNINEKAKLREYTNIAMPNQSLFQPLIADPKWPRFTVAYQYYLKDGILKHAFAPNFGASFPLYKLINNEADNDWELGIQGGLFGIMDIGKNPSRLVNADYFIAIPIAYRSGSWSSLARFYHTSSHLGDELILSPQGSKIKRINLSYEGVDILLSRNLDSIRLYGGGGYIIHKEPSYIKPLKIQAGVEYYSNNTYMDGRLRPVLGIDMKIEQQALWKPGISCKLGMQLENSALINNKVQLMLEFYSGKSIHGQFYMDKVQYIGIGLQAFL